VTAPQRPSSGTRLPGRTLKRSFYRGDATCIAPELLNKLFVRRDETGRVVMAARIVEVEAYAGSSDPASHAFGGETARNAVMFGEPGHMYVYFTYGMHWCANVVCGPVDVAQAVLLRAAAPVIGLEAMAVARGLVLSVAPGVEASDVGAPGRGVSGRGASGGPASRRRASAGGASGGPANGRPANGPANREARLRRNLTNGPARLCQAFGITGQLDGADLVSGDSGLVLLDDRVPPPDPPGVSPRVGITRAVEREWRWYVPGDRNVTKLRPGRAKRQRK